MIIGLNLKGLVLKLRDDLQAGADAFKLMQTIRQHSLGRVVATTKADIVLAVFHDYAVDEISLLPNDIWMVVTHFPEDVLDAVMDILEDPWSDEANLEDALRAVKDAAEGKWTYYQLCMEALAGAGINVDEEEED